MEKWRDGEMGSRLCAVVEESAARDSVGLGFQPTYLFSCALRYLLLMGILAQETSLNFAFQVELRDTDTGVHNISEDL